MKKADAPATLLSVSLKALAFLAGFAVGLCCYLAMRPADPECDVRLVFQKTGSYQIRDGKRRDMSKVSWSAKVVDKVTTYYLEYRLK